MDHFVLSPGITPFITDLTILGFFAAVGIGYLISPTRGLLGGFALDGIALGLYKLYTDLPDPYDDAVAAAALLLGVVVLVAVARPPLRGPSMLWTAVGVVGAILAVTKVLTDFYDPWDLLLAVDLGLLAMYLLLPSVRRRDGVTPPRRVAGTS